MFYYRENILNNQDLNKIKKYLNNINDFKNNPKCIGNKQFGRLQKWYQKDKQYFCPLWKNKYD